MEDLVAVAVELESGQTRYFLTWGRIQDPVDPGPLEELVLSHAHGFDLGGTAVKARVCRTLQEARDEPYFFEGLFEFAAEFDRASDEWWASTEERMRRGRGLYYLGRPR